MKEIVKILMERDNLTHEEAVDLYEETAQMIQNDPMNAEETLMDQLGLEMDYIFNFI